MLADASGRFRTASNRLIRRPSTGRSDSRSPDVSGKGLGEAIRRFKDSFKAGEAMGDARFEEDPGYGVRMLGTFAPGQQQLSFRFHPIRFCVTWQRESAPTLGDEVSAETNCVVRRLRHRARRGRR